ncbi:hypothetical protein DVR12_22460 [Chitinophaga silvatica]|uniref:DUF4878 domain-containing protein n=1 Tax=Chitinophaga silvatica TaxID=2282649 RepID=A0A3E1Y5C7_9BACT|nr:hypothetical protein [Chitinophaga silvatica]RFS19856.1 hypothetical protein DVR12_22460 [Chitinophaga silvatica]
MKQILLLIFSCLLFGCSKSPDRNFIIEQLRKKNIDELVKYCDFPFNLNVDFEYSDPAIKNAKVLKQKLNALCKKKYFEDFFHKNRIIKSDDNIILEVRSFNEDGELESESALNFSFKKNAAGNWVLYGILMAG